MIAEALAPAKRGRPSRADDLQLELVAERAESRILAQRVLAIGSFLAEGPKPATATVNAGGELVYAATRRLRQISASVL